MSRPVPLVFHFDELERQLLALIELILIAGDRTRNGNGAHARANAIIIVKHVIALHDTATALLAEAYHPSESPTA